jgi:magnesium transporter
MQVFLYRNGAQKVEEGFSAEELPALLADKTNVVWADFSGETPELLNEARDVMLNVFKFHALTVEDLIETRNQPKVEAFPDYFYFVMHGVKPEETSVTNFVTKELDGYLGDNFVVTFHIERFKSIKTVKKMIRTSPVSCQRGAAYLLHEILDQLVDLYMPLIDEFDLVINDLEERVFEMRKNNNVVLEEIMDVRRSLARLKRISARQLEVLYRMSHGEFEQVPEAVMPFYRDVHDHLLRISDLAESYRDIIGGLFDIRFAVVSNKTNEIMKTLAVLSAIMLPLTLIAGIYGMNFDYMPELKSGNGYFLTLGGMALIALALLYYFWYKGWIFQPEDKVKPGVKEDKKTDMD